LAPSPPSSVQVTGILDGRSFRLNVFDPASEGWGLGGGQYVLLDEMPTQSPSTEVAWSTTSTSGINQWDIHVGVSFDATLEPRQGAASGAVNVTGDIVCGPTATPGSPSASSASTTATCSSRQLSVSLDKFNAPDVNGDYSAFVVVKNASAIQCTVTGYPIVALYDAASRAIPVALEHGSFGAQTIHDPGARTIDLAPGTAAFFGMHWFNTGGNCTTSVRSEVTLPGDASPRSLAMTLIECPVGLNPGPLAVTAIGTAAAFAGGVSLP
jgi:Protein of unknown function (DUF4232)